MDGVRGLLRDGRYRRFIAARTISVYGSTIAPIALSFAILGLGSDGEATQLGIVLFARFLAQVIFTFWGGLLADRFSRQHTMVLADLAAGVSQAVLALLLLTGRGTVPLLIVLSFANGIAISVFLPAADGVLPLLMPLTRVRQAQAAKQTGENAARILAATSAGVLVAVLGSGWALMVDAATFFVSAALLSGLGLPGTARADRHSMISELRGGLREVTSRSWMVIGLIQFAVLNFCNAGGIYVLGPVFAEEHFRGAIGWSIAIGAQTVGFLLGSMLALRIPARRPLVTSSLWGLGWVAPFLAMGFGAPLWVFVAGMLISGLSMHLGEVLSAGVTQTHIPVHALSRVSSIELAMSFTLVPLGFAVVGPISELIGVRPTLLVYAGVMTVAVIAALSSRSLWSITAVEETSEVVDAAAGDSAAGDSAETGDDAAQRPASASR
ncbi:MAG: MFS transporter [Kineosporiaceae bacterium]